MSIASDRCALDAQQDVGLIAHRVYVDLPPNDEDTELVIIVQRRKKHRKIFVKKKPPDPRGAAPYLPGMN